MVNAPGAKEWKRMSRDYRGARAPGLIQTGTICLWIALLPPSAFAEDSDRGWTPPSPADLPTKFDWVQLPSGEWLGGEVVAL
jgi:hypothetical protein